MQLTEHKELNDIEQLIIASFLALQRDFGATSKPFAFIDPTVYLSEDYHSVAQDYFLDALSAFEMEIASHLFEVDFEELTDDQLEELSLYSADGDILQPSFSEVVEKTLFESNIFIRYMQGPAILYKNSPLQEVW